jgi:8-oxo-dGTP diphosphatase
MKGRRTISAGGVVVNRRGQVLVVSQRGRAWSLPKGHVDPGETLLEAAVREIHEETGVADVSLLHYLGCYERCRIGKHGGEDPSEWKELHFFLFRSGQVTLAPLHVFDHPEARWLPLAKAAALLTHPRDRVFLISQQEFIQRWSR